MGFDNGADGAKMARDGEETFANGLGKVTGLSLHAGVAAKAHQRDKLEHLCRYIARTAVSQKRLSLTAHGQVLLGRFSTT